MVATEFDFPGSIPPRFQNVEATRGAVRFALNEGIGEIFMTLFNHEGKFNGELPWVREGKLFKVRFSEYGLYERPIRLQDGPSVARPFHLEFTVTLHQRRGPDPPVVRDFDLPLPSAGLVSPR